MKLAINRLQNLGSTPNAAALCPQKRHKMPHFSS